MPRQGVLRVHLRIRVRQDHAVKFKTLHQFRRDQENTARRQRLVSPDHRRRVLSQKFFDPLQAPSVPADHCGQAFLLFRGADQAPEPHHILISGRTGHLHRRSSRSLHRCGPDPLLPRQQPSEDLRDLRRRPVTGQQREFRHFAEQLADLVKRCRPLPDRLELISQHHKLRIAKISPEHHQLRCRIVLHFIDHDVTDIFVAHAGQQHFEPDPFRGSQFLPPEDPAADPLYIQKSKVADRAERAAVLVFNPVLLPDSGLVCHFGIVVFLVVPLHPADLDSGDLRQPVRQDVHEPLACLDSAQSLGCSPDLPAAQDAPAFLHDGPEILLLEAEALQGALYFDQVRFRGRLVGPLVGRVRNVDKIPPSDRPRILLAEVRQHLVDVLAEHRIDREQIDLVRPQILPLAVEKVGDPLQQHRSLPASRDSVHQQHRHVGAADDRVLLLLDRRRDGLHLVGAAARQRLQQHRILDRHLCVKKREQPVLLEVVLPPQLQVHVHPFAINCVEGLAVFLIVVGLRDR